MWCQGHLYHGLVPVFHDVFCVLCQMAALLVDQLQSLNQPNMQQLQFIQFSVKTKKAFSLEYYFSQIYVNHFVGVMVKCRQHGTLVPQSTRTHLRTRTHKSDSM